MVLARGNSTLRNAIGVDNAIHYCKRVARNSHTALDIVLLLIQGAHGDGVVIKDILAALRNRSTKLVTAQQLVVAHSWHLHNNGIALGEVEYHDIATLNMVTTRETAI